MALTLLCQFCGYYRELLFLGTTLQRKLAPAARRWRQGRALARCRGVLLRASVAKWVPDAAQMVNRGRKLINKCRRGTLSGDLKAFMSVSRLLWRILVSGYHSAAKAGPRSAQVAPRPRLCALQGRSSARVGAEMGPGCHPNGRSWPEADQ